MNSFNDLGGGLGENRLIEFQEVSETPPKPSGPDNVWKPDLIVDNRNLPTTSLWFYAHSIWPDGYLGPESATLTW